MAKPKNIITAKSIKERDRQECIQSFGAFRGTRQLDAERWARHNVNRQDPARLTRVLAVFGD
jgi:hypothetical protein